MRARPKRVKMKNAGPLNLPLKGYDPRDADTAQGGEDADDETGTVIEAEIIRERRGQRRARRTHDGQ